MPKDTKNYVGQTFNRWTVTNQYQGKWGKTNFDCKCECGTFRVGLALTDVKSGHSKSCGCLKIEKQTFHGHSKRGDHSLEYASWRGMKKRCFATKGIENKVYSERGIKICEKWLNSFESFLEDVGHAPGPTYTIDRIDNNGDYEPANVRWATKKEQGRNRRSNHILTIGRERKTVTEWSEIYKIAPTTVFARLKKGMDGITALSSPVDKTRSRY